MVNKNEILAYMRSISDDCIQSGEINATQLAEDTAEYFEHPEWLDDPDHPVWDYAVDIVEEFN